ncbi:MAG: HAMP domain-containing protein, partial [Chloroflexota bacterium]
MARESRTTTISARLESAGQWLFDRVLSVPVRVKITGIILLPVIVLGLSLNYWVTTGLSDWLSYLLTDERVRAAMAAGGRSVLLVTFLAAVGSVILAGMLTHVVTRPLLALREMAQRVAEGDLASRAPVWSRDEIGQVAIAINQMTDHLVKAQERLTRSNRRLSAINQVIQAAEREVEIHDVLYAVLRTTLETVGLEMGWVYLRDPERDQYHLASWHNVPEQLQQALLHEAHDGTCRCQQDLLDAAAPVETAVRACRRLRTDPSDTELVTTDVGAIARHVTIPIAARGQKYGMMNLLCPPGTTLSDDDMALLSDIGVEVSERVANAWLQLKLEEKEAARQLLLESLVEAQEEERSRLARELHDATGQMLTGLLVRLKTAERKAPNAEICDSLRASLDMVADTIE